MNKLFKIVTLLLFFLLSSTHASQEMRITIKNNSYDIKSSVELEKTYDDLSCQKTYELTFESKYHIFENYSFIPLSWVNVVTKLYNISPERSYAHNKSKLHIVLNESDLKKLYETKSARIIVSKSMFNSELLQKEVDNINSTKSKHMTKLDAYFASISVNDLEPTIRFNLNLSDLSNLLKESDKQYSECMKQKREAEKPANRLKSYFGF